MNPATNEGLIRRFWRDLNARKLAIIDEICAINISSFSYGISRALTSNIREYKKEFEELFRAFPDYELEIIKIIASDREVWVYGMQKATQKQDFHGIPSSFNKFEIALFSIYELEASRITNETILTDTLKLYQNLGEAVMKSKNPEKLDLYMKHLGEIGLIPKKT
ncbi:MAG: ester cyclase [Candidatus Heimdallarchaeota archaeon]|nr:ester cyclase [Candidatus Heimdallarchaeota archaeon]